MKEIRGTEAVKYATSMGVFFCIDETALVQVETNLRGKSASMADVEDVLAEQLDEPYDPTNIVEGSKSFDFLFKRYGDGWIYVPLEGNHPSQEEKAILQLFQRRLATAEPLGGGDILDLITQESPELEDTGFPKAANLNLLFHAALRLVNNQKLAGISEDSRYGKTYFHLPPDVEISFSPVLCPECVKQISNHSPAMHTPCVVRLQAELSKSLAAAAK